MQQSVEQKSRGIETKLLKAVEEDTDYDDYDDDEIVDDSMFEESLSSEDKKLGDKIADKIGTLAMEYCGAYSDKKVQQAKERAMAIMCTSKVVGDNWAFYTNIGKEDTDAWRIVEKELNKMIKRAEREGVSSQILKGMEDTHKGVVSALWDSLEKQNGYR
jgi:hypothetical protein